MNKKATTFDDSKLPINDLSPERSKEIELLIEPSMKEAIEKLRRERPDLFKQKNK